MLSLHTCLIMSFCIVYLITNVICAYLFNNVIVYLFNNVICAYLFNDVIVYTSLIVLFVHTYIITAPAYNCVSNHVPHVAIHHWTRTAPAYNCCVAHFQRWKKAVYIHVVLYICMYIYMYIYYVCIYKIHSYMYVYLFVLHSSLINNAICWCLQCGAFLAGEECQRVHMKLSKNNVYGQSWVGSA
jgi:hypothetical protein